MKQNKMLIKEAIEKNKILKAIYVQTWFKQVIGKFIYLKLIENSNFTIYRGKISLDDALHAGYYEPRILELVPAVFLKKPKTFLCQKNIPADLLTVISEIRHNKAKTIFRGVKPELYIKWLAYVGHKNSKPSIIKTYRFNSDDLSLIEKLKQKYNINETELIRKALKSLA